MERGTPTVFMGESVLVLALPKVSRHHIRHQFYCGATVVAKLGSMPNMSQTELPFEHKKENEPGYLIGIALIGALIILLWNGFAFQKVGSGELGVGTIFFGIYLVSFGFMFLASYYYSYKSFFFRCLMWVCENLSRPTGNRKMAFFYFAGLFVVGIMFIVKGLETVS